MKELVGVDEAHIAILGELRDRRAIALETPGQIGVQQGRSQLPILFRKLRTLGFVELPQVVL